MKFYIFANFYIQREKKFYDGVYYEALYDMIEKGFFTQHADQQKENSMGLYDTIFSKEMYVCTQARICKVPSGFGRISGLRWEILYHYQWIEFLNQGNISRKGHVSGAMVRPEQYFQVEHEIGKSQTEYSGYDIITALIEGFFKVRNHSSEKFSLDIRKYFRIRKNLEKIKKLV